VNRSLTRLAIIATIGSLLCSNPIVAQVLPPAPKAAHVEIIQGPELELAHENFAIIRWSCNNPGGADDHYGTVKYGTSPGNLSQTANSLWHREIRHESGQFEPDRELSHQAQPGPYRDSVPCERGRPETSDDLLLHSGLDGERWLERWCGEPC
jgi:hypothetical protein